MPNKAVEVELVLLEVLVVVGDKDVVAVLVGKLFMGAKTRGVTKPCTVVGNSKENQVSSTSCDNNRIMMENVRRACRETKEKGVVENEGLNE